MISPQEREWLQDFFSDLRELAGPPRVLQVHMDGEYVEVSGLRIEEVSNGMFRATAELAGFFDANGNGWWDQDTEALYNPGDFIPTLEDTVNGQYSGDLPYFFNGTDAMIDHINSWTIFVGS